MTTADPAGTTPAPGTYDLLHEAWHFSACRPDPGSTETGRWIQVQIGLDDAACAISITEHRFPSTPTDEPSLRILIWDDGWAAVERAPALFSALARLAAPRTDEHAVRPTIESVKALLDQLGFVDRTTRQSP